MRVAVMEMDEEIKTVDIQPDEKGSYLCALQRIVGGRIASIDVLYGEQPPLWINDSGVINRLPPSRALYANKRMEDEGYLSLSDLATPVKDGDLYMILFGPIVACSYEIDESGERVMRDISDDELSKLEDDLWNKRSGIEEAIRIKLGLPHGTR